MNMEDWKVQSTALAVIYRILEKGDDLVTIAQSGGPTLEPALVELASNGYLTREPNGPWVVTQQGKDLRGRMVGMYDQLLKFEIFGAVDVTRALTADECREDDPNAAMDNLLDPRFAESPNARDLRLAMIQYVTDVMAQDGKLQGAVNPYLIVFMQKLADGELQGPDFWVKLASGEFLTQVQLIVDSADKWQAMGSDLQESNMIAGLVYRAGLLEQRKRNGHTCSECGSYLAVYEDAAKEAGQPFNECPCGASFLPAPVVNGYQCPSCNHSISARDSSCRGCGAYVDFSRPAGTVTEETITTVDTYYTPVWGSYYGYTPYGYYNPYNPFVDAVALSLLCVTLW